LIVYKVGLGWSYGMSCREKKRKKKRGHFVMEQWTAAHLWFVNYKTEDCWLVGRLEVGCSMNMYVCMQNGEDGDGVDFAHESV